MLMMTLLVATTQAQFLHRPGQKASDFEGKTVDGKPYHLYESQAERIIVCFWSVNCDLCHDFMTELRQHHDLIEDCEFVSFALADTRRQVRKTAKRMKLPGWHFFDEAGWDSQPFVDYDVLITPTVILIDKDKNIVGEAYDWDEFKELLVENGTPKGSPTEWEVKLRTE